MAQFTLSWNNTAVNANPNATAQTALYRGKTAGGAFSSMGFTPSNNMAKSVNSALSPVVSNNIVYEFKVQSVCSVNGPTDNDNGLQEAMQFECILPTLTKSETTATATISVTGLDITRALFTLRRASDNVLISGATQVDRIGNSIAHTVTGLTGNVGYYWQIELIALVKGVQSISSDVVNLGAPCGPYAVTTDAPAVCNPITAITVSSIEIV